MSDSMKDLISKGESEVRDKLKEGTEKISDIGNEFQDVKDQLQDMPGGLDSDLLDMIREAEASGREEATADIDAVKSSIIDAAKSSADTIKGRTESKITDNDAAIRKLEGINSKYGKDQISQAHNAIEDNTKQGEDLLRMMEEDIRQSETDIAEVENNL